MGVHLRKGGVSCTKGHTGRGASLLRRDSVLADFEGEHSSDEGQDKADDEKPEAVAVRNGVALEVSGAAVRLGAGLAVVQGRSNRNDDHVADGGKRSARRAGDGRDGGEEQLRDRDGVGKDADDEEGLTGLALGVKGGVTVLQFAIPGMEGMRACGRGGT